MSFDQCSGLALKLIHTLSEREFSKTICELKRHMDRQSRLFLKGQTASSISLPDSRTRATPQVPVPSSAGDRGDCPGSGSPAALAVVREAQGDHLQITAEHSRDPRKSQAVRVQQQQTLLSLSDCTVLNAVTYVQTTQALARSRTVTIRKAPEQTGGPNGGAKKQHIASTKQVPRKANKTEHKRVGGGGVAETPAARPSSSSMASSRLRLITQQQPASSRRARGPLPSERTFVKLTSSRKQRVLDLPHHLLLQVFRHLGPRERLLPVCRRWLELGRTAELWQNLQLGARGSRQDVVALLQRLPLLQRLVVKDRKDLNHILGAPELKLCQLRHVHLARCSGPGSVSLVGLLAQAPALRSLVVLDTPQSAQMQAQLATPDSCFRLALCQMTATEDQAAAFFGNLLKAAVLADEATSGSSFRSFSVTFSAAKAASHRGTLLWRREGSCGELSFNGVILNAVFRTIN